MIRKLLIVEDEKIIRQKLVSMDWEKLKIKNVYQARNGKEALSIIKNNEPQVIISDINMPFMTGIDLVKQVKSLGINANFIFLTGYENFEYAQQAVQLQVFDYILKPINENKLMEKVSGAFDKEENSAYLLNIEKEQILKQIFSTSSLAYDKILLLQTLRDFDIKLAGNFFMAIAIYNCELDSSLKALKTYFSDVTFVYTLEKYTYFWCGSDQQPNNQIINEFFNENFPTQQIFVGQIVPNINEIGDSCISIAIINDLFDNYPLKNGPVFYEEHFQKHEQFPLEEFKEDFPISHGLNNLYEWPDRLVIYLQRNYSPSSNNYDLIEYVSKLAQELFIKATQYTEIPVKLMSDLYYFLSSSMSNKKVICLLRDWVKELLQYITPIPNRIIDQAKQYINENYSDTKLNLTQVADKLHVNTTYLSQLFSMEIGITYTEYLLDIRMIKAKERIICTQDKIYVIAEEVGFKNTYYFSNCFKKYTGYSPLNYRELFKKT